MIISESEILLRLLLAVFIGGAVGLERERKNQPAGLRTHIAVILGAALIMIISKYGFWDIDINTKDPARLAAQVVSGIGFLGAGTIIVHKNMIRGLTTAASLWTTACIGLAVGAGMYVASIGTAVLLLVTLVVVQKLEQKAIKKKYRKLTVYTTEPNLFVQELDRVLISNDIGLKEIEIHDVDNVDDDGHPLTEVDVFLHLPVNSNSSFLLTELTKIQGVKRVES